MEPASPLAANAISRASPGAPRRRVWWWRWLRRLLLALGAFFLLVVLLVITLIVVHDKPWFQSWLMARFMPRFEAFPKAAEAAARPSAPYEVPPPDARELASADDLYRSDRIWTVHLRFTEREWLGLNPRRVAPASDWIRPDGSVRLLNTNATRNGLAGVLGFDFPWSASEVDFGGISFYRVGIRYKGNGTFLEGLKDYKRPFKLQLGRHRQGQQLAGRTVLNLGNLGADPSAMSDVLAYEFFREAGVPAPRATYARVFLSIEGRMQERLLGLYVMVENPDREWADDLFGVPGIALFKPTTYALFDDLGDDWRQYERTYDPKTPIQPAQASRVMAFARLVTSGTPAEFAAAADAFLDLVECARFFAAETLLSNYDGIYNTGQNYLIYLDPIRGRMGFIPWDLDHAWGEFPLLGTAEDRERASIWHPWVGENRFLERLFALDAFRVLYRAELERLLATQFTPAGLRSRIDALASVVGPALAEESETKLARFRQAVADGAHSGSPEGEVVPARRSVHSIKRFVAIRAQEVRDQLNGRGEGTVLTRKAKR
jgi:hypothetical protein